MYKSLASKAHPVASSVFALCLLFSNVSSLRPVQSEWSIVYERGFDFLNQSSLILCERVWRLVKSLYLEKMVF